MFLQAFALVLTFAAQGISYILGGAPIVGTAIMAAVSIQALLTGWAKAFAAGNNLQRSYVGAMLLLVLVVIGGYLQTSNNEYATYKLIWFGFAIFMSGLVALRGVSARELFLTMIAINGLLFIQYISVFVQRDWLLIGDTYQYVSLMAGFCTVYWLQRSEKLQLLDLLFIVANIFVLLNSGSRTPLLGVGAIMLYKAFTTRDSQYWFILAAGALTVLTFLDISELRTLQRFAYVSEGYLDSSSSARIDFWTWTLEEKRSDFNFFFGRGLGMWPLDILGDAEGYPHNIFLEFYYEYGLIGLSVLIYISYLLLVSQNSVFKYLALYFFVFLQLSGGLESTRWFMVFFALAVNNRSVEDMKLKESPLLPPQSSMVDPISNRSG